MLGLEKRVTADQDASSRCQDEARSHAAEQDVVQEHGLRWRPVVREPAWLQARAGIQFELGGFQVVGAILDVVGVRVEPAAPEPVYSRAELRAVASEPE